MVVTDPIEGQLGSLVLSRWVAKAPTGHDEAYLLLATPDERAPTTMALLAEALGLSTDEPGRRLPHDTAHVRIEADSWIRLVVAGQALTRLSGPEWTTTVQERRQAVLHGRVPADAPGDERGRVHRPLRRPVCDRARRPDLDTAKPAVSLVERGGLLRRCRATAVAVPPTPPARGAPPARRPRARPAPGASRERRPRRA